MSLPAPLRGITLRLCRWLYFLEDAILVVLVISMVVLSFSQLALRNAGVSGMVWSDSALRINVLWLAMFGALRASRLQQHISIDLLSRYLPERARAATHFVVSILSAAICAIAAWYSLAFVMLEKEDGALAFLNVPVWLCEAIIPAALGLIAVRFLGHALNPPEADVDRA